GVLLYTSPAITRILGYEAQELVDRDVFTLIHPDDLELARYRFQEALAGAAAPLAAEVRYRHRDGSWRYLEIVRANHLDNPSVRGIVVNYRDATARREAAHAMDQ